MSNLYRGPPIDASYQVSVHLGKRFQRRRILKISQSETRTVCGGHDRLLLFLIGWFLKHSSPLKPFSQMKRNLVGSIYGRSSIKIAHVFPIHLQNRGPAIDASYQVSDNLAKRFQRRFFRNRPIRIKNCLWWPCLLMDRDEINFAQSVNKHGHHRLLLFLIGWFLKNSSPLKPFSQMNRNLVGSIYGKSSVVIAHFVPIC
jgi:hypothetical protein